MKRVITPLAVAAVALLSACGGGGEASGPDTAAGSALGSSAADTDAPDQSAGGSRSGSAGAAGSNAADGSNSADGTGAPFGEEERDGDDVEFVTTSSTTTTTSTTTLPPTTTSTTSTTTTSTTSTSTTSTSTSTTTTVPTSTTVAPTTMQCSFAADALFEPGEAVLTAQSIADLGRVVAGITDVRSVRVEGHTDHRGTDDENLALSQARADAAAAALVDSGVEESLITAVGLGESAAHQDDPSGGPTDEEMAANRRVDVIVDAEVPITTSC